MSLRLGDRPVVVTSPSPAIARLSAAVLGAEVATDGATAEGRALLIVLSDPVLASVLDDAPWRRPGDWLIEKCRELDVPVPIGGDFPFSEGLLCVDETKRVFLTRFESLHLLGGSTDWAAHLTNRADFENRCAQARFDFVLLRRLYKDSVIRWLYWPLHRSMMRRKWSGESRRHLIDDEVIVYHHVPKCAGMSVFHHLNAHLKWQDELVHLDARAAAGANAHGLPPFSAKDPRELDRIEVLFGHDVSVDDVSRFQSRKPLLVSCLREPASRMLSHYNWEMHQFEQAGERVQAFDEWYALQPANWMTRWLAERFFRLDVDLLSGRQLLDAVNAGLSKFWIVCTTERLEPAMKMVTDKLGLPEMTTSSNRAGESYPLRAELTADLRARITADHPLDSELFQRWSTAA